jgi:hypothetical protein
MAESSLMNESQLFENLPKEIFRQKMRKKLSLLALLKDSYREKELIEKYKDEKTINAEHMI